MLESAPNLDQAEVLALHGGKRNASQVSMEQQGRAQIKRRSNLSPQQAIDIDTPATNEPKKKRIPLRQLLVLLRQRDIWQRLQQVDSGLSLADWLALDKKAY